MRYLDGVEEEFSHAGAFDIDEVGLEERLRSSEPLLANCDDAPVR
jgi:hypothetical protein